MNNRYQRFLKFYFIVLLLICIKSNSKWCLYEKLMIQDYSIAIDFNSDNDRFMSVQKNNCIVLIGSIKQKKIIDRIDFSNTIGDKLSSGKFSKNGKLLGISTIQGSLFLFSTQNYTLINKIKSKEQIVQIDFSWYEDNILICNKNSFSVINYNGSVIWSVNHGISSIISCKFNKQNDVGLSFNQNILAWYYFKSIRPISYYKNSDGKKFYQIDFSKENLQTLRLISGNQNYNYYALNNQNQGKIIYKSEGQALAICVSPDNGYIGTGGKGKFVILQPSNSGDHQLSVFTQNSVKFYHCRFSYDSNYLIASTENQIYLYKNNCNEEKCKDGQYLFESKCYHCKQACLTCEQRSVCKTCKPQYTHLDGQCIQCPYKCKTCNRSQCIACQQNYVFNKKKNICAACKTIYQNCIKCNQTSCLICQDNNILINGKCIGCYKFMIGCQVCKQSKICIKCIEEYNLTSSKLCIKCSNNQYFDIITSSCIQCSSGCKNCYANLCFSCYIGYNLVKQKCIKCPENCQICNENGCLKCFIGFYKNNATQRCQLCSHRGCFTCDQQICFQCLNQYIFTPQKQCLLCEKFQQNCMVCNDIDNCQLCKQGYYQQNGRCKKCINNCAKCNDQLSCKICNEGYFKLDQLCLKCRQNCIQCLDSNNCSRCYPGFKLDSHQCLNSFQSQINLLKMKFYYISENKLKYYLFTQFGNKFEDIGSNLSSYIKLCLLIINKNETYSLNIRQIEWEENNEYIILFTNNPISQLVNTQQNKHNFSNLKIILQISIDKLQKLIHNVSLMNRYEYSLQSKSFQMSYIKNSGEFYLQFLAYIISLALFIIFIIKVFITSNQDVGEIIPHIFVYKLCAIFIVPISPNLSRFCYGLMISDLLIFNNQPQNNLQVDYGAQGYMIYFAKHDFLHLYLIPFSIFLILILFGYYKLAKLFNQTGKKLINNIQIISSRWLYFLKMIYHYFSMGITISSSLSIQGFLYNEIQDDIFRELSFILGGFIYFIQLGFVINITRRIGRKQYLRGFIKGTILSLSYIYPLIFILIGIGIDMMLIFIDFRYNRQRIEKMELWLVKNILLNIPLILVLGGLFNNYGLFSMIGIILIVIVIEIIELVDVDQNRLLIQYSSLQGRGRNMQRRILFTEMMDNRASLPVRMDRFSKERSKIQLIDDEQNVLFVQNIN